MMLQPTVSIVLVAGVFTIARILPLPWGRVPTSLLKGLLVGLLLAAFHGARITDLHEDILEGQGALLALAVLGASTVAWQIVPQPEQGKVIAFRAATFAFTLGTGALLLHGGAGVWWALLLAMALGLSARWLETTKNSAINAAMGVYIALLLALLLQDIMIPSRLQQASWAFATGGVAATVALTGDRINLRHWWIFAVGAIAGLAPGIYLQ